MRYDEEYNSYTLNHKDLDIVLDALEALHENMKHRIEFGLNNYKSYSMDDVDGLFQSFDNSSRKTVNITPSDWNSFSGDDEDIK